jgi:diguanylate cyclase (GGDEF)-like protein
MKMNEISVFISYKWQDEKRNKWVEKLYRDLRSVGIDAKLDKYEVAPGESFSDYMTREIRECNFVLFIVTPKAVEAVESGEGALAFEMQISNARRLARKDGFRIIPIFREGDKTSSYLSDHRYLDFRNEEQYDSALQNLIDWLHGSIRPPVLGKRKANVSKSRKNNEGLYDQLKNENKLLATELEKAQSEMKAFQRAIKVKEIELNAVIAQAEEVSYVDELTALPNLRSILSNLKNAMLHSTRSGTPLAILFLDLDGFKQINDSRGHTVGDQVLFQLANILQESIRDSDAVGRYGGDEFLVVLPNTNLKGAEEQAVRLCKRIHEAEINVGEIIHLTASIGVAEYRHGQEYWQKLLSRADMAHYEAKNAGRDRWAISE